MALTSRDGGRQPGPGDIVQFGRQRPPTWRWLGSLLLASLVGTAVAVIVIDPGGHRRAAPQVAVTDLGHRLLGVRAGWQLIGLDGNGVVAIQLARGRIVRTAIPQLARDGLVSLVAVRGEVIVRPLNDVPGYIVPDGQPARTLTGALARAGTLLPGPTPSSEWLDGNNLELIGPGGKREQAHLPASALLWATQVPVIADGRGGLILTGGSGRVYDANDGVLRTVSALPLAVGPRNWLGLRCDKSSCRNVVISAATGASRALPGPASYANPWPWQALPGVVSPDGATAAVIVQGNFEGQAWLDLVSLTSGVSLRVPVPVATDSSSQSLAWSPDSGWLFVVTARGALTAVDARTGLPRALHLGLSGFRQIVISAPADTAR